VAEVGAVTVVGTAGIDDAVARAMAREAELQKELDELRVFLAVYRKLYGQPSRETPAPNSVASDLPESTHPTDSSVHHAATSLPPQGIRQVEFMPFVRGIILEHGRPMQQHEILKAFKNKGRHVGGANELENLKSKLWRARDQIINIGGSGYWPIDVECPEVSYLPPIRDGGSKT
jgi:hypothetical protein